MGAASAKPGKVETDEFARPEIVGPLVVVPAVSVAAKVALKSPPERAENKWKLIQSDGAAMTVVVTVSSERISAQANAKQRFINSLLWLPILTCPLAVGPI